MSVAWGEPMRFDEYPRDGKGYKAATAEIEDEIRRLWEFLVAMHELGRPDGAPPRRAAVLPRPDERAPLLGTVAVVGFPNVGKSTLVNRLSATREAVVFETPGVTRDRKEVVAEWAGKRFILIDTGGVDVADPSPLTRQVAEQAERAVAEADLVLFVTDARRASPRRPGDRRDPAAAHKPVVVVANKVDDPSRPRGARVPRARPRRSGARVGHARVRNGRPARHVVAALPGEGREEVGEEAIRVAILGRPNVGKSSLLNALVGQERVVVSEIPGTTRDSIDTVLRRGETTFVLVDTAGLRRKRRQRQGIEYYSELRAMRAAERADVALVLVDSSEGVVDQDLAVADVARTAGCSTLVVLSKWDIADDRHRGRAAAPREHVSASARRSPRSRRRPAAGSGRLLDRVEELFGKHTSGSEPGS